MARILDAIGSKFGRLTLLQNIIEDGLPTVGIYRCECGTELRIKAVSVRTGHTSSCGCLRVERARVATVNALTKHGLAHTKVWNTWSRMKQRCTNNKDARWHQYGGAGIKVCERWMSFENFLADMGQPPTKDHSLDRIDPHGDYTPENCRWADCLTQQNNRRNNRYLTINGETKTLAQWCRAIGVNYGTAWSRMKREGLSPYAALGVSQ